MTLSLTTSLNSILQFLLIETSAGPEIAVVANESTRGAERAHLLTVKSALADMPPVYRPNTL